MKIFDKFLNPDWFKISNFRQEARSDLFYLLCLYRGLREHIQGEIGLPLETFLSQNSSKFASQTNSPTVEFTETIRRTMIDEIEIGFLAGSAGMAFRKPTFFVVGPDKIIEAIGILALNRIKEEGKLESAPATLKETGYSCDLDESRVQVILAIALNLGLETAFSVPLIADSFFTDRWSRLSNSIFSHVSSDLVPLDQASIAERAKSTYQTLSKESKNFILELGKSLEKKATAPAQAPKRDVSDPPIGSEEWRRENALLFLRPEDLFDLACRIAASSEIQFRSVGIEKYELLRLAKAKPGIEDKVVTDTITLDFKVYGFVAVVAEGLRQEDSFGTSGYGKMFRDLFEKENIKQLQLRAFNCMNGTFGPISKDLPPNGMRDVSLFMNAMNRIRVLPREYIKNESNSDATAANYLFNECAILGPVSKSPSWQGFFAKLTAENQAFIKKRLAELAQGELMPKWSEKKYK